MEFALFYAFPLIPFHYCSPPLPFCPPCLYFSSWPRERVLRAAFAFLTGGAVLTIQPHPDIPNSMAFLIVKEKQGRQSCHSQCTKSNQWGLTVIWYCSTKLRFKKGGGREDLCYDESKSRLPLFLSINIFFLIWKSSGFSIKTVLTHDVSISFEARDCGCGKTVMRVTSCLSVNSPNAATSQTREWFYIIL